MKVWLWGHHYQLRPHHHRVRCSLLRVTNVKKMFFETQNFKTRICIRPVRVTCGDWKLDQTDTDEKSLVVSSVVSHPGYKAGTFENDMAVIKVVGSMACSQGKIWPACLPNAAVNIHKTECKVSNMCQPQKYTYEGWADTLVSGWGTIVSGGDISNTLKYVKVPPVSDATCNAADSYGGSIVSDQMICAGETITVSHS